MTLIIAEVIPFLVLAVGVDNVFILVHELDRQNAMHGPNAASWTGQGEAHATPLSPTRSTLDSLQEGLGIEPTPQYVVVEERVARTLAKMGPSILLSTISETVAFALGALVPMPAVRNFALYAAGSVLLNAIMQITVLVSVLSLDLKRLEVSGLPHRMNGLNDEAAYSGRTIGLLPMRQASTWDRTFRLASCHCHWAIG